MSDKKNSGEVSEIYDDFDTYITLFKDIHEFTAALRSYRKNVFKDIDISMEMINLLIDYFVMSTIEAKKNNKRKFLREFMDLYTKEFCVQFIKTKSKVPMGKGSYGKVYESVKDDEVIKLFVGKQKGDGEVVFDSRNIVMNKLLFMFIIEFFTYVVWSTVINYADTYLRTNTSQNKKIFNNNPLVVINRPFIVIRDIDNECDIVTIFKSDNKTKSTDESKKEMNEQKLLNDFMGFEEYMSDKKSGDSPKRFKFCIGYYMKRYEMSLKDVLKKHNNLAMIKKAFTGTLITFYGIDKLCRMGIGLSHRDTTANNIMIDSSGNATLIDFGFALTNIKFSDSSSWDNGYFFEEAYNTTFEPFFDTVLFIAYLIEYHYPLLEKLNLSNKFKNLISYASNKTLLNSDDTSELWLYPYKADIRNKNIIMISLISYLMIHEEYTDAGTQLHNEVETRMD